MPASSVSIHSYTHMCTTGSSGLLMMSADTPPMPGSSGCTEVGSPQGWHLSRRFVKPQEGTGQQESLQVCARDGRELSVASQGETVGVTPSLGMRGHWEAVGEPSPRPTLARWADPRTHTQTAFAALLFQSFHRLQILMVSVLLQDFGKRDRESKTVQEGGRDRKRGREGERGRGRQAGEREHTRDEIETWKNLLPRKFHSAI